MEKLIPRVESLKIGTSIDPSADYGPLVTRAALDTGVWVRPFRNLVYTMPPFVSTADDLATITAGIVAAIKQVHG